MGLAPPAPAPAGRGAAIGVRRTPEGSPPAGLPVAGAWVLHMPAVGLVVDDRGRMKQSVLTYPSARRLYRVLPSARACALQLGLSQTRVY